MTAYDYINKFINVKLCPSNIDGVGVFALRDIQKDEELFKVWEGESGEYTLSNSELDSLDENVRLTIRFI